MSSVAAAVVAAKIRVGRGLAAPSSAACLRATRPRARRDGKSEKSGEREKGGIRNQRAARRRSARRESENAAEKPARERMSASNFIAAIITKNPLAASDAALRRARSICGAACYNFRKRGKREGKQKDDIRQRKIRYGSRNRRKHLRRPASAFWGVAAGGERPISIWVCGGIGKNICYCCKGGNGNRARYDARWRFSRFG